MMAGSLAPAACSSVALPLPCNLMIVALPADSTLRAGDPLPAELQVLAGPGDFDGLGTAISTDANGYVTVDMQLRGVAVARFAAHTAGHIGEPMAIVINGDVVGVALILTPIVGGELAITPATDDKEAFKQRFAGCIR